MLLRQSNDVPLACGAAFSKVPSKCWTFSHKVRLSRAAPAAFSWGCFKEDDTSASFSSCAFRMWINYQQQHSTAVMREAALKTKHFRSIPLCCGTSSQTSWNALCLLLMETLYFWNSSFIYASGSSVICRYESSLRDSNTQYFLCRVPSEFS